MDIELSKCYQTLFSIDSYGHIDMRMISKYLKTIFKKEDKIVIHHLLKYYFYLDTDFVSLDDAILLLTKSIYDRYVDYLCNDTAFRIIFHPSHTIRNQDILFIIENLKSFYEIDKISIHRTTKIGVLNELIHLLQVRDKSINFNIFVQYLHALNGLNSLKNEELEWEKIYIDISNVERQTSSYEDMLKREMIEKHNKCMKYRLSKIYLSLESLTNDNNKPNILTDPYLDRGLILKNIYDKVNTSDPANIKNAISNKVQQQFPYEDMVWIEAISDELISKNGILNKKTVVDDDYALLIDSEYDYYRIYKRTNDKWIYIYSVPEEERIAPIISKKTGVIENTSKNNLKFESLCNLEGMELETSRVAGGILSLILDDSIIDKDQSNDEKCIIHNSVCVAKKIADIDKQLQYYKHGLKSYNYIIEQKQNLTELLFSLESNIIQLRKDVIDMKVKKSNFVFEIKSKKTEKLTQLSKHEMILKTYKERFFAIKNIKDEDIRFTELERFIMSHGLFDRDVVDDKLIKVPASESSFIYWDIPNIIEKMCCKHWLFLVKQAYKSNSVRRELQKKMENIWGIQHPNTRFIICKHCDLQIGLNRESDNDGFDGEDRLIQYREAVIETSIDETLDKLLAESKEDLSSIFVGDDSIYLSVFKDLITDPNIDIPYSDKKEILANALANIHDNIPDLYHFEADLITKDTADIKVLEQFFTGKEGKSKAIDQYRLLRNTLFPGKSILSENDISSLNVDKNKVFLTLFNFIKDKYKSFYYYRGTIYLCGRLVVALILADPEYKITGSQSRQTSQTIYSNFLHNPNLAVITVFTKLNNLVIHAEDTSKLKQGREKKGSDDIDIYSKIKLFMTAECSKLGIKTDEYLKGEITQIYIECLKNPILNEIMKDKINHAIQTRQLMLDKIKNAIEWKTFRPYLKISENLDNDIDKLDSSILDVEKALEQGNNEKYYSYLLSNRLFYCIQRIINTSVSTIQNAFTNFCCLTNMRVPYLQHFINIDNSIGQTLEKMLKIHPKVFYNPHQNLFLLYGEHMNIVSPNLLEYINEKSPLSNNTEVEKRIIKLITTYTILDDELDIKNMSSNLCGKKRLYSIYYDKYYVDSKNLTKDALREKMENENRHADRLYLERRLENIYSKYQGVIKHDIISNKYHWDIEYHISTILEGASADGKLRVYYDLLTKLYKCNSLNISSKLYESIPLFHIKESTLESLLEQHSAIYSWLNKIIENIKVNYNSDIQLLPDGHLLKLKSVDDYINENYSEINNAYNELSKLPAILKTTFESEIGKSSTNIGKMINDGEMHFSRAYDIEQKRISEILISINNDFQKKTWKELNTNIISINTKLKTIHPKFTDWTTKLNSLNRNVDIAEEIHKKAQHQVLIEGYSDDGVLKQIAIRRKYIDNKIKSRNFDTIKKYYKIVQNQISRFKYFSMECPFNIINRKIITNKNLIKENEYDFDLNRYIIKSFLENRIYTEINKNEIMTPIDSECINVIPSYDKYDESSTVLIETNQLYVIVLYLIQVELLRFIIRQNREESQFVSEFCYRFIWENNMEQLETLNMMTEKQVSTHLRNILSKENRDRLQKFGDLTEAQKIVHKLKRDLGVGNMGVPDDENMADAVSNESEFIEEIEKQYNDGDLLGLEKNRMENEQNINSRINLLLGADANESDRALVRDYLEEQDAEDLEAAQEFGMAAVPDSEDPDNYNEEALD